MKRPVVLIAGLAAAALFVAAAGASARTAITFATHLGTQSSVSGDEASGAREQESPEATETPETEPTEQPEPTQTAEPAENDNENADKDNQHEDNDDQGVGGDD
jgi:hypothetical protein